MENLNISLIQTNIVWENQQANLAKLSVLAEKLEETDVIILPEMFTTGFSMNPEKLKEPVSGDTVKWMINFAAKKNAAVVGSLIVNENGLNFNRAYWVFPDGTLRKYDKRHLFTMGQEADHYSRGISKTIVEFRGWRFCPLICYDLRFPVWSRNTENYDVLIYMANWPSARHHVWKNLLISRAIENQSFCFGVNRTGTDGTGLNYLGDSALVTPKGFADFLGEPECAKTFSINFSELHNFRKNFPVLDDRDEFQIKI